jgi:hypothetical protein
MELSLGCGREATELAVVLMARMDLTVEPGQSKNTKASVSCTTWKEEEGLFKPDDVAFEQSHRGQGWSRVSINPIVGRLGN